MRAVILTVLLVIGAAPAGAGESEDSVERASIAASVAPEAFVIAGIEAAQQAQWRAGRVSADLVEKTTCNYAPVVHAHQTQRDVWPVAVILARDVTTGYGACATATPDIPKSLRVCVGGFWYNAQYQRYAKIWESCSPEAPFTLHGVVPWAGTHVYAFGTYPKGVVLGCAWITAPYDAYSGRLCTGPQPVV